VRLPDGSTRSFSWDPFDQPTRYVDENGAVTTWAYAGCGLLAKVVRPHGGTLRFAWSTVPGRLLAVFNEREECWRFHYNAAGHLIRETDFAQRETRYTCNKDGVPVEIEDAAGQKTVIRRNDDGAPTVIYYDDESWGRFEYEPRGLLTRVDNSRVPVERSYDALGRMVREKQGMHVIESEYDLLGNRVRRRSSLGGETTD